MVIATEATCNKCGKTFMQGDCRNPEGFCHECEQEPYSHTMLKMNAPEELTELEEANKKVKELEKENEKLKAFAEKIMDGLLNAVKWLNEQE